MSPTIFIQFLFGPALAYILNSVFKCKNVASILLVELLVFALIFVGIPYFLTDSRNSYFEEEWGYRTGVMLANGALGYIIFAIMFFRMQHKRVRRPDRPDTLDDPSLLDED